MKDVIKTGCMFLAMVLCFISICYHDYLADYILIVPAFLFALGGTIIYIITQVK